MKKSNLENLYNDKIVKSLLNDLGVKNIMQVPKLKKIVLNMGMGDVRDNKNAFQQAIEELTAISGQKPIVKILSLFLMSLITLFIGSLFYSFFVVCGGYFLLLLAGPVARAWGCPLSVARPDQYQYELCQGKNITKHKKQSK